MSGRDVISCGQPEGAQKSLRNTFWLSRLHEAVRWTTNTPDLTGFHVKCQEEYYSKRLKCFCSALKAANCTLCQYNKSVRSQLRVTRVGCVHQIMPGAFCARWCKRSDLKCNSCRSIQAGAVLSGTTFKRLSQSKP